MTRVLLFLALSFGLSAAVAQPPAPMPATKVTGVTFSPGAKGVAKLLPGGGAAIELTLVDDAKPKADEPKAAKFPRGHKQPTAEVSASRHLAAAKRNGGRVGALPTATPATFDCRAMGWCGLVQDQGNCGSCWDVSATGVITNGYIKAGLAKADGSFVISPQYVLDCGQNGGCDGDDAPTVLDMALSKGLPTAQDYGPYKASPGACKYTNQKLYKINAWGFCTPNQSQGMASTQDIKNSLVQYGPLSTAVVADSSWDGYSGGVLPFEKSSPNSVDHDVSIIGWDDAKTVPGTSSKGAWLVLNQWGASWGEKGCVWIGYGSHQIGTEAAWVSVAALPPVPPTPGPTPDPTPVPPIPPTPPVPPVPGVGFTGTIAKVQTYKDGVKVGDEIVQVTPAGGSSAATVEGSLRDAGVPPALILDAMKLFTDLQRKDWNAVWADAIQIFKDIPRTP